MEKYPFAIKASYLSRWSREFGDFLAALPYLENRYRGKSTYFDINGDFFNRIGWERKSSTAVPDLEPTPES